MARVNFSALKVGDTMFLASPYGWSDYTVREYVITKITPKGQITCKSGNREIRVTPRGSIVGAGQWNREHFVTAEQADELRAELNERNWCEQFQELARTLEKAARSRDREAILSAATAIAQAIEARSGETERLDPKGESAVRKDAPNA